MRRSVAGFLLVLLVLLCPRGWAQQDLVTEIVIHGNRRIPADTVKARIFTHPGDVYDAAGLERDFNSCGIPATSRTSASSASRRPKVGAFTFM